MTTTLRTLYDTDYALWTQTMAKYLRQRDLDALDVENLAEEIESLGKRDRRELVSRLEVLLMHLLKWQHQSQKRSTSWQITIKEQRRQIARILSDSPSLKPYLATEFANCYQEARDMAVDETGLDRSSFPENCEWTIEQVSDRAFWPEP